MNTPLNRTQELRGAAKTIREILTELTDQAQPPQQPLMWFAEDLITGATITGDDLLDHVLTPPEVAWIARIEPKIGEHLAAALEAMARAEASFELLGLPPSPIHGPGEHLLEIARLINRNTQEARYHAQEGARR